MQKIPLPHLAGLSALTLCIGLGTAFVASNQTQASIPISEQTQESTPLSPEMCTDLYEKVYGALAADLVLLEDRRACNATCKRIEIAYYNKDNKTWKDESGMPAEDLAYKKSCKPFYERSPLHQAAEPQKQDTKKETPITVKQTTTLGYTLPPAVKVTMSFFVKDLTPSERNEVRDLLRRDLAKAVGISVDRLNVTVSIINSLGNG